MKRAGAAVGVLAAAAATLVVFLVLRDGGPTAPVVDDPVTSPSPPDEPTEETPAVAPEELPAVVLVTGPERVALWTDGAVEELATEGFGRLAWLPDTGAVGQRAQGEAVVPLGPGPGDGAELVGARDDLLLRAAGRGPDGNEILLVTWTRPAEELGPELVLGAVDAASGQLEELGVIGNREDGPDALALDGAELVVAYCHLQCSLHVAALSAPLEGRELARADWRGGVAATAEMVATVGFHVEPAAGEPSGATLVLHDRTTGDVITEVEIGATDSWAVTVSLTSDATAALVTLGPFGEVDTRTYLVDGLPDDPRIRLLEGTGGALFAGE